jgi:hypothetical protein
MKDKTFNLQDFCSLISRNKDDDNFHYWLDLINIYSSTMGGCSCNRNQRLENANVYYKSKMINAAQIKLEQLKTFVNVEKLIFTDNQGQTFFEF